MKKDREKLAYVFRTSKEVRERLTVTGTGKVFQLQLCASILRDLDDRGYDIRCSYTYDQLLSSKKMRELNVIKDIEDFVFYHPINRYRIVTVSSTNELIIITYEKKASPSQLSGSPAVHHVHSPKSIHRNDRSHYARSSNYSGATQRKS